MARVNLVKAGKLTVSGLELSSDFDDSADHKIGFDIQIRLAQQHEHLKNT